MCASDAKSLPHWFCDHRRCLALHSGHDQCVNPLGSLSSTAFCQYSLFVCLFCRDVRSVSGLMCHCGCLAPRSPESDVHQQRGRGLAAGGCRPLRAPPGNHHTHPVFVSTTAELVPLCACKTAPSQPLVGPRVRGGSIVFPSLCFMARCAAHMHMFFIHT